MSEHPTHGFNKDALVDECILPRHDHITQDQCDKRHEECVNIRACEAAKKACGRTFDVQMQRIDERFDIQRDMFTKLIEASIEANHGNTTAIKDLAMRFDGMKDAAIKALWALVAAGGAFGLTAIGYLFKIMLIK